jgi:hypothetical protein
MLVRWSVGPLVCWSVHWLVGWLVGPHITSKTDYVAIASRLGFGVTSLFLYVSYWKKLQFCPEMTSFQSTVVEEPHVVVVKEPHVVKDPMGVWQGAAMDSLKYCYGPPYATFLCPRDHVAVEPRVHVAVEPRVERATTGRRGDKGGEPHDQDQR